MIERTTHQEDAMRLTKKHEGKAVELTLCGDRSGEVVPGLITKVRNNIATVEFQMPGFTLRSGRNYTAYLDGKEDASRLRFV